MSPLSLSALANHLWQSTLFVAVVGFLALSLKRNQAQLRHWLWLAASAKFLVPFAALIALGGQFGWQSAASVVQPDVTFVIDAISQPFSRPEVAAVPPPAASGVTVLPILLLAIWFCGCAIHLLTWWVRWRRVAVVVREGSPIQYSRELDAFHRLEKIVGVRQRLAVVISDTSLEPGVFGILNPVLVWPRSIGERLDDRQIEAILAHELCHIRRRDNLAVAIHMVVEALFWFHPVVWWLEQRLVDERERACDEEVIRLGSEPQVYAESIVKTCEFYIESPSIVAGVTGSDLKKRVEAIMRNQPADTLNTSRKLLLATVGAVTLVAPIIVGALSARPLRAQSVPVDPQPLAFEVASVKINKSNDARAGMGVAPGGRVNATNVTLRVLVRSAYRLMPFQICWRTRLA